MKKRMIFVAAILSIGLMATPISAEDVTAGLDLDSMSVEDLVLLRDAVNQKIGEKGGDNIIGEGIFEVGVDIKAGSFKVICNSDDMVNFYIYDDKEAYDSLDMSQQVLVHEGDKECGILNLKNGQVVSVSLGSAIIEEVNASWAPEE